MATVGFLHTDSRHVALFARLVAERAPALTDIHLVDETLLDDVRGRLAAGCGGIDDDLRRRLGVRIGELVGRAADAVVCTCTVLGEEAVRLTGQGRVPVYGPRQGLGIGSLEAPPVLR